LMTFTYASPQLAPLFTLPPRYTTRAHYHDKT
jgi:hypothetical protein